MKRRREVTIEIEREFVISNAPNHWAWCAECAKHTQMLTAVEGAQIIHSSESEIHRLAESRELHSAATNEGMLLICPDSLLHLSSEDHIRPLASLMLTDGEIGNE